MQGIKPAAFYKEKIIGIPSRNSITGMSSKLCSGNFSCAFSDDDEAIPINTVKMQNLGDY